MADRALAVPSLEDVQREFARPAAVGFGPLLAQQLRDHVAAIREIREAARGLSPVIQGVPPGVQNLASAIAHLETAAIVLDHSAPPQPRRSA